MAWLVRVRNFDNTIADVIVKDWAQAQSAVNAYRASGREAWIMDANGNRKDDKSGETRQGSC